MHWRSIVMLPHRLPIMGFSIEGEIGLKSMNRVLGITVPEIADADGATAHRVNAAIREVADKVKTGDLIWLECSDNDRAAAQARLEKRRLRDKKILASVEIK